MAERLTRLLLDTSVVIAGSQAVKLNRRDTAAISVITIGELRAGVRLAADPDTHTLRQARLAAVRDTFEPLPVDEPVAEQCGEILAAARAQKRTSKATDLLIIATAAATGRALLTLDNAQAGLARLAGVPVRDTGAVKAERRRARIRPSPWEAVPSRKLAGRIIVALSSSSIRVMLGGSGCTTRAWMSHRRARRHPPAEGRRACLSRSSGWVE